MLRLRPYKESDASTIISWCGDEIFYYKWSAGMFGEYPITEEKFKKVMEMMPFVAFDESGIVGFFTMRNPGVSFDEIRFGFIILDPKKRGMGYGKKMLQLGLKFAFDIYGASKVSLGVFENNESAYQCYKAVGFQDKNSEENNTYKILGEDWTYLELAVEKGLELELEKDLEPDVKRDAHIHIQ